MRPGPRSIQTLGEAPQDIRIPGIPIRMIPSRARARTLPHLDGEDLGAASGTLSGLRSACPRQPATVELRGSTPGEQGSSTGTPGHTVPSAGCVQEILHRGHSRSRRGPSRDRGCCGGSPAGSASTPARSTSAAGEDQTAGSNPRQHPPLLLVEAKCVEMVSKQVVASKAKSRPSPLNSEQWRALVALHYNLLYDHHDFFLASQHPSASPALRRLRHGIHSFLESLRHRLPDALEHMLAFIYLAYSMVTLLYETVPAFKDTGTGVARFWYSKATDKDPTVNRFHHHLAILARPDGLRQLYYYFRSLACSQPFLSAKESALTLFDPILKAPPGAVRHRPPPLEEHFVKAHGILFTLSQLNSIDRTIDDYLVALNRALDRVTAKWKKQRVFIAVANATSLFEYRSTKADLKVAFDQRKMDYEIYQEEAATSQPPASSRPLSESDFRSSVQMAVHSADVSLSRAIT
ncbi:MAG: hypothetical protein M1816_003626 [Peltula sp. TS41687]|nr:MAG: hypothetical protein M1816_003626 [Peltula sp. TS41687]